VNAPFPPDRARAALSEAVALFQAGRMGEAASALQAFLAAHGEVAEAIEMLGAALGAQGRAAEALAVFDRARDLRPSSHAVRHNRAQALFALGRYAEARGELEHALRLAPDHQPSWNLLGNVFAALGDAPGAERAYRRSILLRPGQAEPHYNLGVLLQEAGRRDEAIACYRRALELRPAFAAAHNNLANALRAAGQLDAAIAHYTEAIRHDPQLADALSNFGTTLREISRVDEAIALLERAARLKPEAWAIHNNLGGAYLDRHRVEEALQCFGRALALRPDFHEARNNLGNALAVRGAADEAAACYRQVLAQEPANADALSNLGLVLQEKGADAEAIAHFERALAIRPDHSDALNNLGYLLQEQGRRDEAMAHYRRAMQANPNSARAGYNLGLAHLARFEFERGWNLHELRFNTAPPVSVARRFAYPRFEPGDWGRGERLAIWPEQGVGDQLLYSTLLPELASRGQAFTLETDRRFAAAFARAHPEWDVCGPEDAAARFAGCTRHVPIASLGLLLRPTLESFAGQPHALLQADPLRAAAYRERLAAPGMRVVGISWRSFQPRGRAYVERKKSVALELFMELSQRSGLRLLDLQYGDTQAERARFEARGGVLARLPELDLFNDLDGLLAAIEACDVVVTTSNVTAHLAGVLGKRTFLFYLRANPPFHYWAPRADGACLWYPSTTIVTGPSVDSWETALARVHELIDG
jgi:tetratricopeptide (TPR) repeat protein